MQYKNTHTSLKQITLLFYKSTTFKDPSLLIATSTWMLHAIETAEMISVSQIFFGRKNIVASKKKLLQQSVNTELSCYMMLSH